MSKRIKDTDYLFITSLLRARESKLLNRERIDRMLDSRRADDALKILEECGYGELSGLGVSALNERISQHMSDSFSELSTLVPDRRYVDVFRIKYDYHNAKVLIKSEAMKSDGSAILSRAGRVGAEELTDAFHTEAFDRLPKALAEALADAKDTLARTSDPQQSDLILDRAYFAEYAALAKEVGSRFLIGYGKLLTDNANLRTAVRAQRIGKDPIYLKSVLFEGGSVDCSRIVENVMAGEPLSALFISSPLHEAALAGDKASEGGKLTEFEKLCDNALVSYIASAKSVSFGESVLAAYLCAVENECTAARIVVTGIKSGLGANVIRERLRDSYV